MIRGHHYGLASRMKAAPEPTHWNIFEPEKIVGRGFAEGHDDLRGDDVELSVEKGAARRLLIGRGCAVARWAAFHNITYINFLSGQSDGLDDLRQELPCCSNKWHTLAILIGPRTFAGEQEPRFGAPRAEDDRLPLFVEWTPFTAREGALELIELLLLRRSSGGS